MGAREAHDDGDVPVWIKTAKDTKKARMGSSPRVTLTKDSVAGTLHQEPRTAHLPIRGRVTILPCEDPPGAKGGVTRNFLPIKWF